MSLTRRGLLHGLGAVTLAGALAPGWAAAQTDGEARLVLLLLRGGMDGLGAVPPVGDPAYRSARGSVAGSALELDGYFGLHPALSDLLPWWKAGDLAMLHATALPYRERSHFDAQNVLESGASRPFATDTGWLNRAVGALGGTTVPMAMARTVPLVLRGPADVTSADPLREWAPDNSLLNRIADLYASDPDLGPALEAGIQTQGMLETHRTGMQQRGGRPGRPDDLRRSAQVMGRVIAADDGPRIAVAEAGGWDTHTGQEGNLDRLLGGLAGALTGLRDGLGDAWEHTAVLVVTEFGRTVHANGTGGTDHGTGSVAFAAGGAVNGGAVHGDWPGIETRHQQDGRDLKPTTDVRGLFKGALLAHLGVSENALEDDVFKGTREVPALTELFV